MVFPCPYIVGIEIPALSHQIPDLGCASVRNLVTSGRKFLSRLYRGMEIPYSYILRCITYYKPTGGKWSFPTSWPNHEFENVIKKANTRLYDRRYNVKCRNVIPVLIIWAEMDNPALFPHRFAIRESGRIIHSCPHDKYGNMSFLHFTLYHRS